MQIAINRKFLVSLRLYIGSFLILSKIMHHFRCKDASLTIEWDHISRLNRSYQLTNKKGIL